MGILPSSLLNLHLRFNRKNPRHMKMAELLSSIPVKYKTASIIVAYETYMALHPEGFDMDELKAIQQETYRPSEVRTPRQEHPKPVPALPPTSAPAPVAVAPIPPNETATAPRSKVPDDDEVSEKINAGLAAFDIKIE